MTHLSVTARGPLPGRCSLPVTSRTHSHLRSTPLKRELCPPAPPGRIPPVAPFTSLFSPRWRSSNRHGANAQWTLEVWALSRVSQQFGFCSRRRRRRHGGIARRRGPGGSPQARDFSGGVRSESAADGRDVCGGPAELAGR